VTDQCSPLAASVAVAVPAVADTLVVVAAVATDHPPGLVVAADILVAAGCTDAGADNTPLAVAVVDVDLGTAVLAAADLAVATTVPADHRIVVAAAAAAGHPIAIEGEGVVVVVAVYPPRDRNGGMAGYPWPRDVGIGDGHRNFVGGIHRWFDRYQGLSRRHLVGSRIGRRRSSRTGQWIQGTIRRWLWRVPIDQH